MHRIEFGRSDLSDLEVVQEYFDPRNILFYEITPRSIHYQIAYHLNQGVDTPIAIELFNCASKIFKEANVFFEKERLAFRDLSLINMNRWLEEDFCPNKNFNHYSVEKLYGTFANFDTRMPEKLHLLMKRKLHENIDHMNGQQAAAVLNYYARTADFIPHKVFDALAPLIMDEKPSRFIDSPLRDLTISEERELLFYMDQQIHILMDLAIIGSLRSKGVTFEKYSPEAVYNTLFPRLDPLQASYPSSKMAIAQEWFEGGAFLGVRKPRIDGRAFNLRNQLASQGLCIQDNFDQAANARTGVDFVIKFKQAHSGIQKSVGVMADTRSGYGSVIGEHEKIQPHGKSYLDSAFVEKANPDKVIVRIVGNIFKYTDPADLAEAMRNASQLKPGVYGLNNLQESVPLPRLSIAV